MISRPIAAAIRALRAGRGRWVASALLVLACMLVAMASHLPVERLQVAWFDTYQKFMPRERNSDPVTIVEVDASALSRFGQWPWPRIRLAELIDRIGGLGALAIGLDMILPEPDQTSPEALMARVGPGNAAVTEALSSLPPYDQVLAATLRRHPVVLGASGFDAAAPSTSAGFRTWPMTSTGGPITSAVRRYPYALASLPPFQAAASGQGLVSADLERGVVRRVPMVSQLGPAYVPAFVLELVRVAIGAPAVEVEVAAGAVAAMRVGDLRVPTQASGRIWIHFSRPSEQRYVSAVDVLDGTAAPDAFKNKIVIIGLTGMGLMDYKTTSLGDYVPGVEAHAQMIESFFDGRHLVRPSWMPLAEAGALGLLGAILIWSVPVLRRHIALAVALASLASLCAAGFALFRWGGLLFDAALPMIGMSVVFTSLFASALAAADHERRSSERSLRLAREAAARVAGELEAARRIQLGILPSAQTSFPHEKRFDLAAVVEPARAVGGDLYDFFMLDQDRLFLQIADVSGKGIPASLFMAITKVLTKSVALREGLHRDRQPLTQANIEISRDNPEALFVTAFAAILDVRTGHLRYWTAGHDTPYLCDHGIARQLDRSSSGPPLCVLEDYEYPEQECQLHPGSMLVLFTDGVSEAQDAEGALYGKERLRQQLQNLPQACTAHDALKAIQEDVARFVNGAPAVDDFTLLVLRWSELR